MLSPHVSLCPHATDLRETALCDDGVRIPAAQPLTVFYHSQTIYPYLTFPETFRSEATIREFAASESLQAAEPSKRLEARR